MDGDNKEKDGAAVELRIDVLFASDTFEQTAGVQIFGSNIARMLRPNQFDTCRGICLVDKFGAPQSVLLQPDKRLFKAQHPGRDIGDQAGRVYLLPLHLRLPCRAAPH